MKKILLALLFAFHASWAFAATELAQLSQDIAGYLQEQSKTPGRAIRYSDGNGELARAILSPARVKRSIDEITRGSIEESTASLKLLVELYKPVTRIYSRAFKQRPEQYEAEYLDNFDILFRLTLSGLLPLQKIRADEVKDENVKAMVKASGQLIQSIGPLMLAALEQQLRQKEFSADFTPQVTARLNTLRAILPKPTQD